MTPRTTLSTHEISAPSDREARAPLIPTPAVPRRLVAALRGLIATTKDPAALLARVTLAVVMFPHGAQHALGWFGGYGFAGTHAWMTKDLGFPSALAALAIVTELLAPLALLCGVGGRVAALGILGLMLGAATTHVSHGFFMNWFGAMPAGAEGFEYHLLAMALAAVVVVNGSGTGSLDRRLLPRASTAM